MQGFQKATGDERNIYIYMKNLAATSNMFMILIIINQQMK